MRGLINLECRLVIGRARLFESWLMEEGLRHLVERSVVTWFINLEGWLLECGSLRFIDWSLEGGLVDAVSGALVGRLSYAESWLLEGGSLRSGDWSLESGLSVFEAGASVGGFIDLESGDLVLRSSDLGAVVLICRSLDASINTSWLRLGKVVPGLNEAGSVGSLNGLFVGWLTDVVNGFPCNGLSDMERLLLEGGGFGGEVRLVNSRLTDGENRSLV